MQHLDLCSGIGGFSLAFEGEGFKTVGFAEVDPYCSKVLAKNWPNVPNYGNVKEIADDPTTLPEFDILTAGYPCQPFSSAGQRKGTDDPRHLWPDIRRIVQARRPTWCVFENVLGHVSMGIDEVLSALEDDGYQTEAFVVPAVAVDAHHRRDRVWIVAHTDRPHQQGGGLSSGGDTKNPDTDVADKKQPMAHTDGVRQQGPGPSRQPINTATASDRETTEPINGCLRQVWQTEPRVGRVANGLPNQSHRLKALGNAIVPQVAQRIAYCIRMSSEA